MAKSKTQSKIEDFIKSLSFLSNQYGIIVDTTSKDGTLGLFLKKNGTYARIGDMIYSFVGEREDIIYSFEPSNALLKKIEMSAPPKDMPKFS